MVRLVLYLVGVASLAAALAWLADRPGSINIEWQGYTANPSVFHAVIGIALLLVLTLVAWSIIRQIWQSPSNIGTFFLKRRNKRGLESLSSGMIAIGAGDRSLATRYAIQARKALPNEPLTHLLRAQAAQLSGDRTTARRIFDAMLASPDTEQLGLRGLFLEAEREGETEAALQYAERALSLNPKLGWSADALFEIQCRQADWSAALDTLSIAKRHGHLEKPVADRRRAVLLAAQSQAAEDNDPDKAMALAIEAQGLAPDLIPAAAIAGRLLVARGNTAKAAKIIQKTWRKAPHPDLATAYAYARIGDSPRDRLTRIRHLSELNQHSIESPIAVAVAAIEAKDWEVARKALGPLLESRLTQRVCTLMAKIEGGEHGDAGRVREWLARAVNAPRDPAWTADGIVSETWSPVSPVTGQLDAFQWRIPVENAEPRNQEAILDKLEELVALGARTEKAPAQPAISLPPRVSQQTSAAARTAEDADIVEVAAPASPAAAKSPEIADEAARTAPVSEPVKTTIPGATPIPIKVRPAAAAEATQPQTPSATMADGVLRTVRAANSSAPIAHRKSAANMYVAPHAPDDPGPDDPAADQPALAEHKRSYAVPYTRPAKQRT